MVVNAAAGWWGLFRDSFLSINLDGAQGRSPVYCVATDVRDPRDSGRAEGIG